MDLVAQENKILKKIIDEKCPDCGGKVRYYHSSIVHGDGITKVICKNKCQGFKAIKEIKRNNWNKLK